MKNFKFKNVKVEYRGCACCEEVTPTPSTTHEEIIISAPEDSDPQEIIQIYMGWAKVINYQVEKID